MITIENKLDIFYKLVFKNEEVSSKKALEEMEEKNKKILEDKVNELQKQKQISIKRRESFAQIQKNEMISKAIEDNRQKVLIKKEELLENLIKSLKQKSLEFIKTKEYTHYMKEKIKTTLIILDEKDIIISLLERDKKSLESYLIELSKTIDKSLEFGLLNENVIGGFIITDKGRSYSLDNSFKTIIEQNRYKIGKELYIALEKSGDLDE